jgi:hypothetical protein
MSIKKFGENDLLINTMKAHPKSEFFIYDGTVYYNQRAEQSGAFSHNVRNVGPGHISLYEYNIDKGTGYVRHAANIDAGGATATIKIVNHAVGGSGGIDDGSPPSIVLTSSDGTERTYAFQNGGSYANGAVVSGTTIRVNIAACSDQGEIAAKFKEAIEGSAGHNGKITVVLSTVTATNDTMTLTQATDGIAGNTEIAAVTNGDTSDITVNAGITATAFTGGAAEGAGGGSTATIRVVNHAVGGSGGIDDGSPPSITLTSSDGTERTYAFQNGGSYANGAVVSGTTIRVNIAACSDQGEIATKFKEAIEGSAGHSGKLTAVLSTHTATNDTLTVTQVTPGIAGNTTIAAITNGNLSDIRVNGGITATAFAGATTTDANAETTNEFIYPFLVKSSDRAIFRSAFTGSQLDNWRAIEDGTIFYGNYPMSASISREYWTGSSTFTDGKCGHYAAQRLPTHDEDDGDAHDAKTVYRDDTSVECAKGTAVHPHYHALRNSLELYRTRSEHYAVSSSLAAYADGGTDVGWDKDRQQINAIMIPSIFYGSEIKPGSLSLKMFVTGTLIGELRDLKQNGELIQVSGAMDGPDAQTGSGSVAGVALYEEGILLLTGNWQLGATGSMPLIKDTEEWDYPKWKYFGAGAEDGLTQSTVGGGTSNTGTRFISMSFDLSFEGTTETQVMTMHAHARRGETNYSNNVTSIEYGQDRLQLTSSVIYQENPKLRIKNIVSSSFEGHSASFNRQVYISKIGIYDENKNLIGVASLSNPILKKEDQDLTFKLKLDI